MRTLNADQLKAVLSMESSLGHIHTLADVENTIDYLAKEEPEAVAGVKKIQHFRYHVVEENSGGVSAVVREYAKRTCFQSEN